MNSSQQLSRIVGILYLLIAVIAPFSMIYVPSTLIVPTDAASTASNIMASEGLFRLGIASDAIVVLIEIVLTVLLYILLQPVSKPFSLIAAFSRLAMTIVQGINLINYAFVLLLVGGTSHLIGFASDQLHTLVLLFLNAHESVALIWGLFFGLHLATLGYLVYRSSYIPKVLGILLIITSLFYLTQSFGKILLPQYEGIFTTIGFLSIIELAFPVWLLIKGVNVKLWEKRALASASA